MKKTLVLAALLALSIPIGVLFDGCGSSSDLAPVPVPTPPCSSPSVHGISSVGSSVLPVPTASFGFSGAITLPSETTATSISLYVSGTATGQVRFGIYYLTSPSLLVAQTDPQTVVSNGWNTANLDNLVMTAGAYILCFQFTDANSVVYQSATSSDVTGYGYPQPWSVFPTTFPSTTNLFETSSTLLSMYLSTCP